MKKKLKLQVLDPLGVITQTSTIDFNSGYGSKLLLTIHNSQYMFSSKGQLLNRIKEEVEIETFEYKNGWIIGTFVQNNFKWSGFVTTIINGSLNTEYTMTTTDHENRQLAIEACKKYINEELIKK